ncbi:hypothetical protein DMB42_01205 [Nonomuraea sp. WAC 01424]|nr:hypothetical protein DMB42_01205 [Nonomuraea sp. WAC 01424]
MDDRAALAWFTAESTVLVAVLSQAAAQGFDAHAWQLAWAVAGFLDRRGMRHERLAVQTTALAAARRAGDRLGQACAHGNLGWADAAAGRFEEAHGHLLLDLYGELTGQARVHGNLSTIYGMQGHRRDADVRRQARAAAMAVLAPALSRCSVSLRSRERDRRAQLQVACLRIVPSRLLPHWSKMRIFDLGRCQIRC